MHVLMIGRSLNFYYNLELFISSTSGGQIHKLVKTLPSLKLVYLVKSGIYLTLLYPSFQHTLVILIDGQKKDINIIALSAFKHDKAYMLYNVYIFLPYNFLTFHQNIREGKT